jgi:NADPH-dependent curcumin reductase CurA
VDSYSQIVLASRPSGPPKSENFRIEKGEMPKPMDGQVLLGTRYLSLDPYMRGRMNDAKSYSPPVSIGGVMEGEVVATVLESRHADYRAGDLVQGRIGWRTHAAVAASDLKRVDTGGSPLTTALGVLGMPGFTAYSGMKVIGRPKSGETVVVAAATGPVGSLVGQLAQLAGARAIGIAGGPEKCAYLRDELKFDGVIDHRDDKMAEQLAELCPDGIDVYFENVGGPIWQAVLPLLNRYARVPACGMIAYYNGQGPAEEGLLSQTMIAVVRRSLQIRGYINFEFVEEYYDEFIKELAPKVASGRIKYREDVVSGLENAPEAFIGMLEGRNFGKLLIKVS